MEVGDTIIALVFFLTVFGLFYLWISSRHKERMALIEKGESADKIFGDPPKGAKKWILNFGIFAIGIALGVLLGSLLKLAGMEGEHAYPAAIFFCAGAALVSAFFISRKLNGNA
jgi:hypothetical protein